MRFSSAVSYDICPNVLYNTFSSNARILNIIFRREMDENNSVCTREFSRIALNIRTVRWGDVPADRQRDEETSEWEGVLFSALETVCCALVYPILRHAQQSPHTHCCA